MFKSEITPDNGFFKVVVTYTDAHGNTCEEKRSYLKQTEAALFAVKKQTEWLRDGLTRYINHADILYHTGRPDFYITTRRSNALMICKSYLQTIPYESYRGISMLILNLEQELRAILPSPGNKSFRSQTDKLEELVWTAARIRKQLKQIANI